MTRTKKKLTKIKAIVAPAKPTTLPELVKSLHLNLGNAVLRLRMFEEVVSKGRDAAKAPVLELLSDQLKRCNALVRQLAITE